MWVDLKETEHAFCLSFCHYLQSLSMNTWYRRLAHLTLDPQLAVVLGGHAQIQVSHIASRLFTV